MVVEDERQVMEEYRRLIQEHSALHFVAGVESQDEALELLGRVPVDALILDLELPQGSGILLLDRMQKMEIEKPFIAVVTNVVSKVVYDAVRNMGADYICPKGGKGFSLDVPLSVIEISAPYRKTKEQAERAHDRDEKYERRMLLKKRAERELSAMGFPAKITGTAYIEEGLVYMAEADGRELSITKELYPYIAKKFDTHPNNVERNVRNAIEKVWAEEDIGRLEKCYPYEWNPESGRPTNAEFFHNMVKKISRQ